MTSIGTTLAPTWRRVALALGATVVLWPAVAVAQKPNVAILQGTYFDTVSQTCNTTSLCELLFAPVAAGKFLLVQRVSCHLALPSTAKIGNLSLRRKVTGGVAAYQMLAPVQEVSDNGTNKNYLLNSETMIAIAENERPSLLIGLRSASSITALCTVHGAIR